ncbi:hypothetical protein TTHERM_000013699 (macronuclear) [Tetrahymena thermophila SB210]|uniref:Uncharacterized protein n=1 Tax=Tetrahymena thermophila (strain SB210) TaxID=312017 RepID=W7XLI7_TETTS|nr:hypothetical protein TTHERM_000013699 [Tetrahymena thermophila SB210]EWS76359.1 hypothetical protein TTHERM_000013699 [Tetrahymena thermophila SB210]|eukprot:XP_012651143.1 hypothetical protein TTHERM_000013699 [Tetrahymena thermophila SB210]
MNVSINQSIKLINQYRQSLKVSLKKKANQKINKERKKKLKQRKKSKEKNIYIQLNIKIIRTTSYLQAKNSVKLRSIKNLIKSSILTLTYKIINKIRPQQRQKLFQKAYQRISNLGSRKRFKRQAINQIKLYYQQKITASKFQYFSIKSNNYQKQIDLLIDRQIDNRLIFILV